MNTPSVALALSAGVLALGLVARSTTAAPMAASLGSAAGAPGIVENASHHRLHICRRYRGSQRCHWVEDPNRRQHDDRRVTHHAEMGCGHWR